MKVKRTSLHHHLQQELLARIRDPEWPLQLPPLTTEGWDTFYNAPEAVLQRLEFLGDALMSASVADELFQHHTGNPNMYTALRSAMVSNATFTAIMARRGLYEAGTGKRPKDAADKFEMIIAIFYHESGFAALCDWVEDYLGPLMAAARTAYDQWKMEQTTPQKTRNNAVGCLKSARSKRLRKLVASIKKDHPAKPSSSQRLTSPANSSLSRRTPPVVEVLSGHDQSNPDDWSDVEEEVREILNLPKEIPAYLSPCPKSTRAMEQPITPTLPPGHARKKGKASTLKKSKAKVLLSPSPSYMTPPKSFYRGKMIPFQQAPSKLRDVIMPSSSSSAEPPEGVITSMGTPTSNYAPTSVSKKKLLSAFPQYRGPLPQAPSQRRFPIDGSTAAKAIMLDESPSSSPERRRRGNWGVYTPISRYLSQSAGTQDDPIELSDEDGEEEMDMETSFAAYEGENINEMTKLKSLYADASEMDIGGMSLDSINVSEVFDKEAADEGSDSDMDLGGSSFIVDEADGDGDN